MFNSSIWRNHVNLSQIFFSEKIWHLVKQKQFLLPHCMCIICVEVWNMDCLPGHVFLPFSYFLVLTWTSSYDHGLGVLQTVCLPSFQEITYQIPVILSPNDISAFSSSLWIFFMYSDAFCLTVIVMSAGC